MVGRGLGWGWCDGSWAKGGGDKGKLCVSVCGVDWGGGGGVGFWSCGERVEKQDWEIVKGGRG